MVGGIVENGVCDTALDRAKFRCEYGGCASDPSTSRPGINVAYFCLVLAATARPVLINGYRETTVHALHTGAGHG